MDRWTASGSILQEISWLRTGATEQNARLFISLATKIERQPLSTVELAMTLDEMIEVLQAAKAGKPIQMRGKIDMNEWRDNDNPAWDFHRFNYRIKPEPREWTLHKSDDSISSKLGHLNAVPYDPERGMKCALGGCNPIRVREVLE